MTSQSSSAAGSGRSFEYEIRLAESFDDALSRHGRAVPVADFARQVLASACTLLQARGGAGKTYTARRLAGHVSYETRLILAASLPSVDDVAGWSLATWQSKSELVSPVVDNRAGMLLIIDGLNETDKSAGDDLLDVVERLAALNPDLAVLITDRLARRATASPYWNLATLGPVPKRIIDEIAGDQATDLHEIPFYLNRHARGHRPHEIHQEELSRAIPRNAARGLAKSAYQTYRDRRKRTIETDKLIDVIGADAWKSLVEAGLVVTAATGDPQFHHHLFHDYLVAAHMAAHEETWNSDGFDVVTLRASSFDSLGLVVSQVSDAADVELLLHRVYDWNFYAAAFVLSDGSVASRVGPATILAILGALGEKRFDRVQPTVVRVEDALRVLDIPLAKGLLLCPDRGAVVRLIMDEASSNGQDRHPRPEWFVQWRAMFTRPDGQRLSRREVEAIRSDKPMVGWTFANTARRMQPTQAAIKKLVDIVASDAEDTTVRWRATHALGPHPCRDSIKVLRGLVADPHGHGWVRYGALRGQLEQIHAEKRADRRRDLAQIADKQFGVITLEGRLRAELLRCLDVDPMPDHWLVDIEAVLLAARATSTTVRETEQLVALTARLSARKEVDRVDT